MILRMALAGLQFGRSPTMESSPALPVPGADIDAVKLCVSQQVWAMIQLRLATRHVHQTGQEMPATQMSLHRSHLHKVCGTLFLLSVWQVMTTSLPHSVGILFKQCVILRWF